MTNANIISSNIKSLPPGSEGAIQHQLIVTAKNLTMKSKSDTDLAIHLTWKNEFAGTKIYATNSARYRAEPFSCSNSAHYAIRCNKIQFKSYCNLKQIISLRLIRGGVEIGTTAIEVVDDLFKDSNNALDKKYPIYSTSNGAKKGLDRSSLIGTVILAWEMHPYKSEQIPDSPSAILVSHDIENFRPHNASSIGVPVSSPSRFDDMEIRSSPPIPNLFDTEIPVEDTFNSPTKNFPPRLENAATNLELLDSLAERAERVRTAMHSSLEKSRRFVKTLQSNSVHNDSQPGQKIEGGSPANDDSPLSDISDLDDIEDILDDDNVIAYLNSHDQSYIANSSSGDEGAPEQLDDHNATHNTTNAGEIIYKTETKLLSENMYSQLRGVRAIKFDFRHLEINIAKLAPTVVWVEYFIPALFGGPNQGRFRTKVPLVTKKTSNSDITLTLQHCVNVPIRFESGKVDLTILERIQFRVTALGPYKQPVLRGKVPQPATIIELWKSVGSIEFRDILGAEDLIWSGEVHLCASEQKRSPADFEGTLSLNLSLLQEMVPKIEPEVSFAHEISIPETPHSLEPCYLMFQIGKVRALLVPQFPVAPLLYLRMKLFSSANDLIETPPIAFVNPFDASTGSLNSETDFNFSQTIPLALNKQFFESFGKAPIIVEVHCIRAGQGSNHHVHEDTLLGLVRLPFYQLIGALGSTSVANGAVRTIQIPDSEYVVKDPFSGDSKGWVQAFMSIGSWQEIQSISERRLKQNIAEAIPVELPGPAVDMHISANSGTNSSHSKSVSSSGKISVLSVEIHRACGLLSLLNDYEEMEGVAGSSALEYALTHGINSYCQINLFPHLGNTAYVESPIVASSFTPEFEYSESVQIEGIDTDLILWMKNGGFATGRIWHRVPSHLADGTGSSWLLGTFLIPLEQLLTRRNGIHRQWMSISFPMEGKSSSAAIEVSLCFKDGFDLGHVKSSSVLSSSYQGLNLNLEMGNVSLYAPDVSPSARNCIFVKWSHPVENGIETCQFQWEYSESSEIAAVEGQEGHFVTPMKYNRRIEMKLSNTLLEMLQCQNLEFQIWLECENDEINQYLGSAFVDVSELFCATRGFQRSRSTSKKVQPELESRYPIINPLSIDLGSASIDIKLTMELGKSPSLFGNSNQAAKKQLGHSSEQTNSKDFMAFIAQKSVLNPNQKEKAIALFVNVQRAMNLPLVSDPLASSVPSPFVRHDQTRTMPPNSFVTLGDDLISASITQTVFQSQVIPADASPSWNFSKEIQCLQSLSYLNEVKHYGKLTLKIWHATEVHSVRKYREERSLNESASVLDCNRQLIGCVSVPLDPLFSGLSEINGWYPILDNLGLSCGQILIEIRPAMHLGVLLESEYREAKESRGQVRSLQDEIGDQDNSLLAILEDHVENEIANKSLDTWIWNGKSWEHRQLLPEDSDTSHQSISNHILKDENNPKKSISESMKELDLLNSKMREKLTLIDSWPSDDTTEKQAPISPKMIEDVILEAITEVDNELASSDGRKVLISPPPKNNLDDPVTSN